ncbi:hypothetical protein JCGZ_23884 [Jatropha curcas]|uniref:MATH domain-containing protein n=1 Tax=Jatropha curcas TaxID=180498 RepID=A0A067L3D7_JATCU|nr:hypothetical protein JCGZ_23884 [Jatropha curcas]
MAETTIEFNANVVGWGFPYFVPLSNIGDPKENYLVDDTLLIEAEITVSNVMHPSVSVETKEPEQQSIQAPPPPPVIAEEKELPKDPSVESKESSQDVLTKSKSLLTELSSRTTTQRSSSTDDISVSPQPDNLQQENEALAGFFNMSLEAIQQANVFGNIEEIIRTLIPNTNDLQMKTVLEDLASRLKEFQEIIPTAKATVEAAENRRKSLLEKTTKLDSKLAESREKRSSLDSELSKISNEVKKIETEIQRLTAQKEKLLVEKKNVVAQVEKPNPEALKDLEEWKKLEEEMKQANAEWVGAKEKSALANIRWKLHKEELGLFEDPWADQSFTDHLGSQAHRDLAREAVRKSLVLLKNGENADAPLLPLPKNAGRILVAGTHASNLGYQCGGWTITWQGVNGNNYTAGTTILSEISAAVDPSTEITYSENPEVAFIKANNFSYAIVVIAELPYAETNGDNLNLTITEPGLSVINNVCGTTKCVVVVISGRPLVIEPYMPQIDALVAAWLPGTEGHGVADASFVKDAPISVNRVTWNSDGSLVGGAFNKHLVHLYAYNGSNDLRQQLEVCRDPRWGRCYESYGEDRMLVRDMTEIISGLQGDAPKNGVPYISGK